MSRYSGHDHYLDPASGVLKNLLGITDAATLEETESALVATRSYELSKTPLKGRFDLARLQAIHHHLFGDLYEWAGQLRTIDVSKGAIYSPTLKAPPRRSSSNLGRKNTLPGLTPPRSATAQRMN